jgi:hypothetical protein
MSFTITGAGSPQRVNDDQQFHQIVVGGRAGGLDHEHVLAADILAHLDEDLIVGKTPYIGLDRRQSQIGADGFDKRLVGIACDQAHAP